MSTRQRKTSRLKPLLLPASCLLVIVYFSYHAVEGQYGLNALSRLGVQKSTLAAELDALTAERHSLEKQVALMRPGRLDSDIVDERARQALNLVHRNDIVIFAGRDGVRSRRAAE